MNSYFRRRTPSGANIAQQIITVVKVILAMVRE